MSAITKRLVDVAVKNRDTDALSKIALKLNNACSTQESRNWQTSTYGKGFSWAGAIEKLIAHGYMTCDQAEALKK